MSTGTTRRERRDAAPVGCERHMRADAVRNRERILEAATTLMAVHGIDVPIDEIAERAQVGVGTVFIATSRPREPCSRRSSWPGSRRSSPRREPRRLPTSRARLSWASCANLCDEFADFKALADARVASGVPQRRKE